MAGVTTIIVARDDLSVPGQVSGAPGQEARDDDGYMLFELIDKQKPDVVVLDARGPNHDGLPAILKLRERTATPILVICDANDPQQGKYLTRGAAECLQSPFDIMTFNNILQDIVRRSGSDEVVAVQRLTPLRFSGIDFDPRDDVLRCAGKETKLTTFEARLIAHFARKPGVICSRAELSEVLYGARRPVSDRAIDAVIVRLRKKLAEVSDGSADSLIKTEFRLGYMFIGRVEETTAV